MSIPVPVNHSGPYASPQVPQMAMNTATPYGPSPYTPMVGMQQTPGYYPQMGAMQQPVMVQQPYPMYRRHCCDGCCDGCCQCCAGLFAALCVCCWCCEEEDDCCGCCYC